MAEVQVAQGALVERIEQLKQLHQGALEQVRAKDKEMDALRDRLGEQLKMLESAFTKRDIMEKQAKDMNEFVVSELSVLTKIS